MTQIDTVLPKIIFIHGSNDPVKGRSKGIFTLQ